MSNVTLPSLNNKSAWQLLSAHDEICRLCHVGILVQHGSSHKNKKSFVALTVFMSQTQHNSLTKLMHKIMTPCTYTQHVTDEFELPGLGTFGTYVLFCCTCFECAR